MRCLNGGRSGVFITLIILCGLFCELPENPRNIDSAGVTYQTLTAIPDRVPMNSVYPCTVVVQYPEFIDSFAVEKSMNSGTAEKIAGSSVVDDTVLTFSVFLPEQASYTVTLLIYKKDRVDSITHAITVFSTIPLVTAAKTRIVTNIDGGAAVVLFDVSDPDSNLLGYSLMQGSVLIEQQEFSASKRARATILKEFSASSLIAMRDTLIRFSVIVTDLDSQISATAVCTLIVRDTTVPAIDPLPPHRDTVRTVVKLPDTIRAVVSDNWIIDSVKFAGNRISFTVGDTVQTIINQLDSGTTIDSLEAWDIAGNRTVIGIALRYSGPKVYPPKIATIFQTVSEGGRFDTIYLDRKVTITDPEATYGKDSLRWKMVVDTIDSGMAVHFDSSARTLYVSGPAGELFHDRLVGLSLTVTDPAGYSGALNGATFVMVEKDDPPRITLKGQGEIFGVPFDTLRLDTCGYDPEKNAQLSWSIDRGTYFYDSSLFVIRCTGLKLDPIDKSPVCFTIPTGKVLILPDSAAVASFPISQNVLSDTLLFTLRSITAGDTVETMKKVAFTWGRIQIVIPIEIPEFHLRK